LKRLIRKILARVGLAVAVIKHIVMLPFNGRRTPEPWLARLRGESLMTTPPDLWEYVDRTSGCIGCGICDVVGEVGEETSFWIRSSAREPSTALLAGNVPDKLRSLADEIAVICPAKVQVDQIARLLEANQKRLGGV